MKNHSNFVNDILGNHLIVDLYQCDKDIINNIELIKIIIHDTIDQIGAKLISEGYKEFSPIGISAFAIISESHISIHTWPEYEFAAVDIFSCNRQLTSDICEYIQMKLYAKQIKTKLISRGKKQYINHFEGEK